MLSEKIQTELIKQLNRESESSQLYLSMASWVERKGYEGICEFLYDHSNEERIHMLKLIRYINKRGGNVVSYNNNISIINITCVSLKELFMKLFEHEKKISKEINYLVEISFQEKDYFTYSFLQWYVEEQIEEEALSKMILDKIKLIGEDKGGLYLFDRDIKNFHKNKKF
ncbi:ferritin [Blattabacterium sp. (Blaberus giganteus)]|uniref:ferritin n=1 Tax=Blattabacterium sp. (Blaberus giganteus) TaxID=1186051 RepID=UPI00025F6FA9|nr:ferritin [Blattabacterium sp. (Blaberus giganteus)]AFJ90853.1 ferroxidase [Blattabacterium sp. (Blaberus giganteus)]